MTEENKSEETPPNSNASKPVSDPPKIIEALSVVRVKVIDARKPFPILAVLGLSALPNIGDLINIRTSTGLHGYRVEWRNFNPFDELQVQVTLGCLPSEMAAFNPPSADSNKERMDEVVKYNLQMFEKAQAYANAIILAGYAGLFTLWSFTQKNLSSRQVDVVAVMLGLSLILYVSWEIYSMVSNAGAYNRFADIIDKTPEEFFARFAKFQADQRLRTKGLRRIWACSFYPTLLLGYGATVLLLYNVLGHLLGLRQWP